jgi:hypothetical protein
MSTDKEKKEIEEDLKWEEYKKKFMSGEVQGTDKYLRSNFRGKVKEEIKVPESAKEDDSKSAKISTSLPTVKKVIKRKKHSKQKKKKEADKNNRDSDTDLDEGKSIASSISPSQSVKFQKSSSNLSKNGGVNTNSNANLNPNVFNAKTQQYEDFAIEIRTDEYPNNDIFTCDESINPYPFDILPYKQKISNEIIFHFYDKMRYNKVIPREKFIGKILLVSSKGLNMVTEGDIITSNISKLVYARLDQILSESHIKVSFLSDSFEDDGTSSVINYLENTIYLVEYIFSFREEGNIIPDEKIENNENTDIIEKELYAMIVSQFSNEEKSDLLITTDENFNKTKAVYYSGFFIKNNTYDLTPKEGLVKFDSRNLYIIENEFSGKKSGPLQRLYQEVNLKYKKFIRDVEFDLSLKDNLNKNLNEYLLHEIFITTSPKINEAYSHHNNFTHNSQSQLIKIGLLLNYNSQLKSIYIRYYKTGVSEWINLDNILRVGNIYINTYKGPAMVKSLSSFPNNTSYFYKHLQFRLFEKIPLDQKIQIYNTILISKVLDDNKFILKEAECNRCLYKIDKYPHQMCKFCNKVYHIPCLSEGEKHREVINETKNENNNISFWACQQCKPCKSCHSNINASDKIFCSKCSSCYHLNCINPRISVKYPPYQSSLKEKWKCENCLQCEHCHTPVTSLKKNFSVNYSSCLDCEKRFERKEYCPVCRKLWDASEKNMIECKCKLWVHKTCDRILTDEYFKKLTKKTYHCPVCRIKKKNKQISLILNDLIKQDKNGIFYNPIDINTITNYTKVIKNPMCFSFIENRLNKNLYLENINELISDVELIFNNAMTFNMPNTNIYKQAEQALSLCQQVIETRQSELYLMSLEFFLFDFNFTECFFSQDSRKFYDLLEQKIIEKFANKLEKIKMKNGLINKINEYRLDWSFPREFLSQILNDGGNYNNFQDNDSDYNLSETEKFTTGRIILPKSFVYTEETNANCISNNCMNIDDEEVNEGENLHQVRINSNLEEGGAIYKIKQDEDELNRNNSLNSQSGMMPQSKFQIKLEEGKNMTIDSENKSNTNSASIINTGSKMLIPLQSEKDTSTGIDNEFQFQNKKRERDDKKPKNKFLKTAEFNFELDTYNSNFEMNRKNSKVKDNRDTHIKMEINETGLDIFNPLLALEEEEENLCKVYDKLRLTDPSLLFLYPSKFKNYISEEDKDEYSAYLHLLASYVYLKDDRKKKSQEKKKVADSEENSNYDYDDVYEEPRTKSKKGRPSKNKREDEKDNISISQVSSTQYKDIKSPLKNKKIKTSLSSNRSEITINNQVACKTPASYSISAYTKHQSTSTLDNFNRLKTEAELFEENINQKSLLPFPAQVCFSNVDLICEKNCYLCGSFDDTHLFLTCSICFENFHSYCISSSLSITQNIELIKQYKWKCQNCKFCECCKQNTNDNLLLYCDSCDRALHTYCLDVKLAVVPESGWKCLTCFKCLTCGTNKYYQPNFPLKKEKDYSIFTRNFNHCFECGLIMFKQSYCYKCQTSDFKKFNKNLIFIKNQQDYLMNEASLNKENKDYIIIMLHCNLCKNWYHSECLGIDENNIKFYFEDFEIFNCLDCHMLNKYKERYLEATYIKYLNVLQMSFTVMTFSKLVMIILKSICADSNIKLHSKLLKVYLKENFNYLLKDKNMCMLLELIRMDVFLVKDKKPANKNKKKGPEENKVLISLNGVGEENLIKEEMNINGNHEKNFTPEQILETNEDFRQLEKTLSLESIKKEKIEGEHLVDFIKKFEIDYHKAKIENDKKIIDGVPLFDIHNSSSSKNESKAHSIYESIEYDPLKAIIKISDFTKSSNNVIKIENNIINNCNSQQEPNIQHEQHEENVNNENKLSEPHENNEKIKIENLQNSPLPENQKMEVEEESLSQSQLNLRKEVEDKLTEGELINKKLLGEKSFFGSRKKRKRISLISDRLLKEELESFFKRGNDELINLNAFDDNKYVNFYNFDIDQYYRGGDGYSNSQLSKVTSPDSSIDGNKLITETIDKLEPFLRLGSFSKRMRKFLFNLILTTVITLKQSLLKWLLNQMMSTGDSNIISHKSSSSNGQSIYHYFLKYQALNNGSTILQEGGNIEYSEEEINKLLDFIDPLEDSPSRNIQCEFCLRKGARKFSGRLLYIKNENWGHANCILWCKGIQESADGNLLNVGQMMNKVRIYRCSFCRKYGATICCDSRKCGKNYHFACAHAKQCVFTDKKQFYCSRCATSTGNKDEMFLDLNTHRRFIVVKNQEFVNDYKHIQININNFENQSTNVFKIIPRFLIGSLNKFGNTTVVKCLMINKKDLTAEALDFAAIKYIEKPQIENKGYINNENMFLLMLNESSISFSNLNINKTNSKDLEELLIRLKLLSSIEKTEVDLEGIKEYSKDEVLLKNVETNLSVNIYSKERFDIFNNANIKKFNCK